MSLSRIKKLEIWKGPITIEPLSGGLSNQSWIVRDNDGAHVVRFGKDYPFHHVQRQRELMSARAAHAAGFGPRVEFAAKGMMVSAFLQAKTFTAKDVCNAPAQIGELLRDFHTKMPSEISGAGFMFWVFHVIRDYVKTLADANSPFKAMLPRLLALSATLEAAQIPMPIIFGHNDLLPANILDDGNRLWLIDFEYAGFSTAMFDLAGAASNAKMNAAQANSLLSAYLGETPDQPFLRAFHAMQCASLLREALWAMVSQIYLKTPGIDFGDYANENLASLDAALENHHRSYGKTKK
jgi:thiamine kinase-like enzyme